MMKMKNKGRENATITTKKKKKGSKNKKKKVVKLNKFSKRIYG